MDEIFLRLHQWREAEMNNRARIRGNIGSVKMKVTDGKLEFTGMMMTIKTIKSLDKGFI